MLEGDSITEVLPQLVELSDKRIVDAGCGDGYLARFMAGQGASVFGVEPNAAQVERARAARQVADERYWLCGAEDLPFKSGEMDAVVFSNSLHHVPIELQDKALQEAARVLAQGGRVIVAEPVPGGAHHDLMLPVQDETPLQAAALDAIENVFAHGLIAERRDSFNRPSQYSSFEQFRERMVRINPQREAPFAEHDEILRENFDRLGRATDGGRIFDQEIRVDVLRKP